LEPYINDKARGTRTLSSAVNIWYFHVKSLCRKNGKEVPEIVSVGASDMEHVIEVENGATIDFDFQIETQLRNVSSTPELEFENNGKKGISWSAEVSPLCSKICDSRAVQLICIAKKNTMVVADTAKIEFREDASHKWQEDPNPAKKLRLSIALK
jgi:hypothetical protein